MAITFSQQDYWALFQEYSENPTSGSDDFDTTWNYPPQLGQGYWREIQLREGLHLAIARHQLHTPVILHLPEREHPLEYSFYLSGQFKHQSHPVGAGQYSLCGSGTAPVEWNEGLATEQVLEVNVHIHPDLFTAYWNPDSEAIPTLLQHLIKPPSQTYYVRSGTTTLGMQTAVQQILQCPFQGMIKRMYLESKVWELMALLIAQELELNQQTPLVPILKPDDVDRIHHARDILLQHLDNPPSLMELARQVGLNDCTLKRGFRQVFGQTAFGYLHNYRLEQARQLLEERQLNVSEIAQTIGFASRSYFAAAFRKKFGVTPKKYRVPSKNSA
ncbi:MAG: AraC family transcriptional regulator [Leptolyngbyaceae bacterium]|nr:AraC family transcriptional regulator [Leptolyngbyaceae bacterium]